MNTLPRFSSGWLSRPRLHVVLATIGCACFLLPFLPGVDAQETEISSPQNEPVDAAQPTAEERANDTTNVQRWTKQLDNLFGMYLVTPLSSVLFFDFYTGPYIDSEGNAQSGWLGTSVPFVVAWLVAGSVFLTFRMSFINFRSLRHSIAVVRGKFDHAEDEGAVSHFQALSSALSATIGLGNIAGVAIAVSIGGPGALFWMVLLGLFGMTSKFTECTLAQMYRRVSPEGEVNGGPMWYLSRGFKRRRCGLLGSVLACMFAVLCVGGSLGVGCAFQVSQSLSLVRSQVADVAESTWLSTLLKANVWIPGAVMMFLVGIVILGGIRRIATTAEKIAPFMSAVYVVAGLTVLLINVAGLPEALATIFREAFTTDGAYGGLIGVMIQGFQRAAFSNEAGAGSAAIAHAAARTRHPVREGIVACWEPFIDTVVICSITGLVIVTTGAYDTNRFPEHAQFIQQNQGALLTSAAFSQVIPWFKHVLTLAVVLFAYSTMISWSYYGERCSRFLFGPKAVFPYRILFLLFVMLGSLVEAPQVIDFSDLMILSMAFPNMVGLIVFSGEARRELDRYWAQYQSDGFASEIES